MILPEHILFWGGGGGKGVFSEREHNKDKLSNREITYCIGKTPQGINNRLRRIHNYQTA